MRLGITAKLFLAILLTCVIASLAMLGAMRYSFQRGFLGYLNEQEAQRVESVLPKLAEAYRQNGSWAFVRQKPRLWFSLIRPEGMHRFPLTAHEIFVILACAVCMAVRILSPILN